MLDRRFSFKNTFYYAATASQAHGFFWRNINDDVSIYEPLAIASLVKEFGLPRFLDEASDAEQLIGISIAISLDSLLVPLIEASGASHVSAIKMACGLVSVSCMTLGKLAEKFGYHEENPGRRLAGI